MTVQEKWESKTALPLTFLAVAYLVIYAIEVLSDASGSFKSMLEIFSNVIWVVLWLDFIFRFVIVKQRITFIRKNLVEIASLVLPAMRAFRMLRVLTAFNQIAQFTDNRAKRANFVIFAGLPFIFLMCALGILDVERHAPGSTITSFGNAIWWSLTTIATVGYGDLYPVTISGRAIAAVLLFTGLGSMSLITANVANWLMQNMGARNNREERDSLD